MMQTPIKLMVCLVMAGAFAVVTPVAMAAEGPGKCGKGKRWDKETKKCVPKPRGWGSGSGSGSAVE